MGLKRVFLVLLILTLPSKLIGDTDIDDDNHQFNLYLGNFDFSDDKQKAVLIGFQHQNEDLNRNTFLGKIKLYNIFLIQKDQTINYQIYLNYHYYICWTTRLKKLFRN